MAAKKETPAFELTLTRVVDAPRERVWKAWADPEQLKVWFAPRPYTLSVDSMDLRAGGSFRMAMHAPDGTRHDFSGKYREVVPPEKIVWVGEFAGGPADQMVTTVTFEAQGQKTKITANQVFRVVTPETEMATRGAKQGWTMTLDQLAELVEKKG